LRKAEDVDSQSSGEFILMSGNDYDASPACDEHILTPPVHQEKNLLTLQASSDLCKSQEQSASSDVTPRNSMAVDSKRQSTTSDTACKRQSSASAEVITETAVSSPLQSVKEARSPNFAGEMEMPGPKEKSHSRKLSFLRKARTSSSPSFTWKIPRDDLAGPVWQHKSEATISGPVKVELNANCGKHNPKLKFKLCPCGLGQDRGKAVTMMVRIKTPDKCPPLPPLSEVHISLVVWSGEGRDWKEVKRCSSIREKLALSRFFVYSVVTHDHLKMSTSKYSYLIKVEAACSGCRKTLSD
jgi:hypothetical protein